MDSSEAPNPLRPYYIPPSIGERTSFPNSHPHVGDASRNASSNSAGIPQSFSHIDYSGLVSDGASSATEIAKRWLNSALAGYGAALLVQPLVVGTTILQVQLNRPSQLKPRTKRRHVSRSTKYEESPSNSDSDEPDYFTSNVASLQESRHHHARSRRARASPLRTPSLSSTSEAEPSSSSPYLLSNVRPGSMLDILSQLQTHESFWGPWKATNTTFVYNILTKTIDEWTASLLSAALNISDPSLIDDLADSPDALTTFCVAVVAKVLASLILAPLDIVRTRQMVTPSDWPEGNGMLQGIQSLPSKWLCPTGIIPITILSAAIPEALTTGAPLFIRRKLGIDPTISPTAYQTLRISLLAGRTLLALPFETVLRRGQMKEANRPKRQPNSRRQRSEETKSSQPSTLVEVGDYTGALATMWDIVYHEGERVDAKGQVRHGQGVEGLFRGWRVCAWSFAGGLACGGLMGGMRLSGIAGGEF